MSCVCDLNSGLNEKIVGNEAKRFYDEASILCLAW